MLLLGLLLTGVKAEPTYRTSELKRLVGLLRLNVDSLHEGDNYFTSLGRQVKVSITDGEVTLIGYHLFSNEFKSLAHTPILNFLERYFLMLDYPDSNRPATKMLREDRFNFDVGTHAIVASLQQDDAFSYGFENHRYQATWSRDNKPFLSVSFPATHEMISGENKIEAEKHVEKDIINTSVTTALPVNKSNLTATANSSYYIKKGGSYLNGLLTSDLYYKQDDGKYALVCDESHPLESSANMMLSTEFATACQLNVTQVMYGYKKKQYNIPLAQWISYCQNNGCELFYGVESFDEKEIKATVIAVNVAENYNHVLFVTIPNSALVNRRESIDARLETFIPMHNVMNLFAKYRKKTNQQPKIYE